MSQTILTASPDFISTALEELCEADPALTVEKLLGDGVSLVSGPMDFETLSTRLQKLEPVFLRHICPVWLIHKMREREELAALTQVLVELPATARLLSQGVSFSVQARFLGEDPQHVLTAYAIKEDISQSIITKFGAVENIKTPDVVVSVAVYEATAYVGISKVSQNLSDWAGGMRRFARESQQISRAEFKLLEAMDIFGLKLPESGSALDLGAAPGGWTRLLLKNGLQVVAVDPAELDPRLNSYTNLRHFRGHAADYLRLAQKQRRRFDIILSDMRVDARVTAELMGQFANLLPPRGHGLATLKLPFASPELDPVLHMRQSLTLLRQSFRLVQAKHLFHNRQEVTVFLEK
ncbi:MAG: methyltransferase domain-containing protein [Chloroflexi bacterium]|uniref:Methyltransferase domain-containing protein n=1 Tax=Candidatus Chlorohelix allophototropha TaxID=3003348 RepID=A0A8T7M0M5_9CHLR|nr:methyltransferase domain-containing protein [Chloroflexota bacterium]WJW66842.1 methyltransferase domain-containing protein [Chloroflexota bacterium L227-S17]